MDLTGTWQGFYEQGGTRHPIEMRVRHRGRVLHGTMRDTDTLLMSSLEGAEAEQLRGMLDYEGEESPQMITSLPATSTVAGEVAGEAITFVKRYDGAQQSEVWVEDMHVTIEVRDHVVLFGGQLEEDAQVMRGEWWVEQLPPEHPHSEDLPDEDLPDEDLLEEGLPGAYDGEGDDGDVDDGEVTDRGAFELRRIED